MSHIFIYDSNHDTIQTLSCALECSGQGHKVSTNLVLPKGSTTPKLILNPADVLGLLVSAKPFPDVIIAETTTVDGGWLCGLVYDLEMSRKCSIILTGHEQSDKVNELQKLYQVTFWPKPFNTMKFVEYIETFLAVSC